MKTFTLILLAALTLTGCFESKFDREKAQAMLNHKLTQSGITEIGFSDSGFIKAKQDLLIKDGPMVSTFTEKGKTVLGFLVSEFPSMFNFAPDLLLKSKMAEKVRSIEGITDAGNGRKLVEFTTDYIFPTNTPPEIKQYLYSGRKAKAVFALYDDGWRIIEE